MIKVSKQNGFTSIHAENGARRILLAKSFAGSAGPVMCHADNIGFYEVKKGIMRSTHYTIGLGVPKSRRFEATPQELTDAFVQAGIATPSILTHAEWQAKVVAAGDAPRLAA